MFRCHVRSYYFIFIFQVEFLGPWTFLQNFINNSTPLISTNTVIVSNPFFTTNDTKIPVVASGATDSISIQFSFVKVLFAIGAFDCVFENPIFAQTCLKL